ncbi:MAG TPA: NlpC/P60 family protein [Sulfurovum sp.]|nr:NlpC/P60 family protein [Sulfurovum sp.]
MKTLYTLLIALSLGTGTAAASAQITKQTLKHTIQKGDTLSSIAKKYHTTIVKVRQANGLKKGEILNLGKVLKVPTDTYASNADVFSEPKTYVIKKGDTLSTIARKHHTSVKKIRKANALRQKQILKVGKLLTIPHNPKTTKVAKAASDQKLAASLSKLEAITLEKNKAKQPNTFKFRDVLVSTKDKNTDQCQRIISVAKEKLGKRYVWGASGNKNTYDCSSFVKYVYRKNGIDLPRTSIMQSKVGKFVKRDELRKGDLIFFDTSKRRRGYVNHVGIYIGNNKFIHASSAKKKVVITSLDKTFYSNRYKGARRPS